MASAGSVIQAHQSNRFGPLPLQVWKATVTIPAAATGVTVTSPNRMSGTVVEAWIDPTTLTAAATIKVYDATDEMATPQYAVNYTVPGVAVETHAALNSRTRVCGTLTCVVASATAADSFVLYVLVDPNADDALDVAIGDVSVDIDSDTIAAQAVAFGAATEGDALGEGVLVHGDDGTDRHNLQTDASGNLKTVEQYNSGSFYANGTYTSAQTNTSLKAAGGGATCHYITDILVTNDGTAAITVALLDGSGGTSLLGTQKVAASGGFALNLRTPLKLTANTALCLTTTGTSNFAVAVSGYTV